MEGSLEAKDVKLKESTALVDRVKALHGEQCHELQRQIEEVKLTGTVEKYIVVPFIMTKTTLYSFHADMRKILKKTIFLDSF